MIPKGIKNTVGKLKMSLNDSRPRSMYQYSNLAPRLLSKNCKFLSFFCLSVPKRDLDTKKTTPNIEGCPESLRAMLECCERGIFPKTGAGLACSRLSVVGDERKGARKKRGRTKARGGLPSSP